MASFCSIANNFCFATFTFIWIIEDIFKARELISINKLH